MKKIVLTGGSCAGKTTIIEYLKNALLYPAVPYFIPEIATLVHSAGFKWADVKECDASIKFLFQFNVFKTQLELETRLSSFSNVLPVDKNEVKVMIYDRGLIDNFAYLDEEYHPVVRRHLPSLWSRYDAVIHLETAASIGQYVLDNPARHEDAQGAIDLDNRIKEVWSRYSKAPVYVIKARDNFHEKQEEVLNTILDIMYVLP